MTRENPAVLDRAFVEEAGQTVTVPNVVVVQVALMSEEILPTVVAAE